MKVITIKTPNTIGCTLVSTIVLQKLRNQFKKTRLEVYTLYPDLFDGLKEVDIVKDLSKTKLENYDVDLGEYLQKKDPQNSRPFRHLERHLTEMTEKQLNIQLKSNYTDLPIKIHLTKPELAKAKSIVKELSQGKPLIWLQTKTSERMKDWKSEYWQSLIKQGKRYSFVDLSEGKYTRRISIAITKYCNAGITLDTFLLHGSHAIGARNVIVILVSSHKEVVTYPEQTVLEQFKLKKEIIPQMVIKKLDMLMDNSKE